MRNTFGVFPYSCQNKGENIMRKFKIYAMTTAAAFTISGLVPMTALAGQNFGSWRGGKVIAVSGKDCNNLKEILSQLGNGNSWKDCIENLPDINWPGQDQPEGNLPQIPGGGFPDIEFPDNNKPEDEVPDNNVPDFPDQTPGDDNVSNSFEEQVVTLVNEERAKAGLNPLTLDTRAASAAAVRSREIQTSFSHTRPDGSSFATALTQAGVSYRSSGENIAYGQTTPQQVMNGWMNSSGHRANILNASFTSIGVGYTQDSSGTPYWTQLFFR